MTAEFPLLLMDIGNSTIKWCVASADGRLGAVCHQQRSPDLPADRQAAAIADRYPQLPVRVCSSARAGLRVGLLGLTDRYSLAAGRRAVLAAGGRLGYAGRFGSETRERVAPVDVLVLVGGTDHGDHRRLAAALDEFRPGEYPSETVVWAGAASAATELVARHRVANVQDDQLRPTPAGLTALLRQLHADCSGRLDPGLLAGRLDGPVLATSLAVWSAVGTTDPVLVIDVGGSRTELHYRAAGTSVQQVFPELGLAGCLDALAARVADEPLLSELVDAIRPADPRALYRRLRDADLDALAAPVGLLACLFASARELPSGPAGPDVLVTGGGCGEVPAATIGRVLEAAIGRPASRVTVDADHQVWARGLLRLR
jgi:hypothetical protein